MAADRGTTVERGLVAALAAQGVHAHVQVGRRATVGLSQETWFADVETDGVRRAVVVRLPTPASGHRAIVQQHRALNAVAGAIPAPRVLWADDDADNPLGVPFLVMERSPGEVPVGWHTLPDDRRRALAVDAIDVLTRLHAVDPARLTGDQPSSTPASELDRMDRRLRRLGPLPLVVSFALDWLGNHVPGPPERVAVVHGDYRMGNFVVEGDAITGVLDWEMVSVGDPIADLAWCFIPVYDPAGVAEDELVARYDAVWPVDRDRLHWHRVYAFVRLAYFALSGIRAFDAGRSDDLRLAALRYQLPVHLDRLARTLAREEIK